MRNNLRIRACRSALIRLAVAAMCMSALRAMAKETKPTEVQGHPSAKSDRMVGKEAGQIRDDNALEMKLAWCPAGYFNFPSVGTASTSPAVKNDPVSVFLSEGFWIGKYEVTQAEWKRLRRDIASRYPWQDQSAVKEGDDYPATYVNWNEAMEFCRRMTKREQDEGVLREDWEYTLPTEAQWECACRAGSSSTFCFGDDESRLGDYAWFNENAAQVGEEFPHEVGKKIPNRWGLHDMHGNVFEFCRDFYSSRRVGGFDPEVVDDAESRNRVVHGGGWKGGASTCASSRRLEVGTGFRGDGLGFRVALVRIRPP